MVLNCGNRPVLNEEILHSRFHVHFSEVAGARLGVGNDPTYNHTECFDPFPFPDHVSESLRDEIRKEAEALDRTRASVIVQHPDLTLTDIYNVLTALRSGRTLNVNEQNIHERGLVSVISRHHEEIDRLVAQAYGWSPAISNAEALESLVALNKRYAAEEERGLIRWLRSELQAANQVAAAPQELDLGEVGLASSAEALVPWPKTLPEQITTVSRILTAASSPLTPRDVARAFEGKRHRTIEPVLQALVAIGQARYVPGGRYAV